MAQVESNQVLLSLPAQQSASPIDHALDIELKLDWEDYKLFIGDQSLAEFLRSRDIGLNRIRSIHLPPGERTRHREVGMAATGANTGAITDFVHTQLAELPEVFLVLHTPREFEYETHLQLLGRLCDLTGRDISIENPPDSSYWYHPEDIAFFGYAGATTTDLANLYLTVDSGHLPDICGPPNNLDPAVMEEILERISKIRGADTGLVEAEFRQYLIDNMADYQDDERSAEFQDPWSSLLKTLYLCGDRVKSIHFNDPRTDGIPGLGKHGTPETLNEIRRIILDESIYLVLEPDRELYSEPLVLRERINSVLEWLSSG